MCEWLRVWLRGTLREGVVRLAEGRLRLAGGREDGVRERWKECCL